MNPTQATLPNLLHLISSFFFLYTKNSSQTDETKQQSSLTCFLKKHEDLFMCLFVVHLLGRFTKKVPSLVKRKTKSKQNSANLCYMLNCWHMKSDKAVQKRKSFAIIFYALSKIFAGSRDFLLYCCWHSKYQAWIFIRRELLCKHKGRKEVKWSHRSKLIFMNFSLSSLFFLRLFYCLANLSFSVLWTFLLLVHYWNRKKEFVEQCVNYFALFYIVTINLYSLSTWNFFSASPQHIYFPPFHFPITLYFLMLIVDDRET